MSFEATRRSFVRLLALTPLAGKAAADEAIAGLAGIKTTGVSQYGQAGKPISSTDCPQEIGTAEQFDPNIAVDTYVKAFGVPAWHDQSLRDQAWNVAALDPDIACKRSWSMNVKIITQRQRNYERLLGDISVRAQKSAGKRALERLLGGYVNLY